MQKIDGVAALKLYGIKNCDTMKKAMAALAEHRVAYEFIDYKKTGVAAERLPVWIAAVGWETLLNRRGLMWKKLSDEERADVDAAKARALMIQYPALIKRPVLETPSGVVVGFDAADYARRFAR